MVRKQFLHLAFLRLFLKGMFLTSSWSKLLLLLLFLQSFWFLFILQPHQISRGNKLGENEAPIYNPSTTKKKKKQNNFLRWGIFLSEMIKIFSWRLTYERKINHIYILKLIVVCFFFSGQNSIFFKILKMSGRFKIDIYTNTKRYKKVRSSFSNDEARNWQRTAIQFLAQINTPILLTA